MVDIAGLRRSSWLGRCCACVVNFSVYRLVAGQRPRVAEQLTALLIVPLLLIFFGQMAGLFVLNRDLILIGAAFLLLIDAILIFLSTQIFERETILTRWNSLIRSGCCSWSLRSH